MVLVVVFGGVFGTRVWVLRGWAMWVVLWILGWLLVFGCDLRRFGFIGLCAGGIICVLVV